MVLFVNQSLKRSGKQYIASLNTENFNAMETTLSEIEMLELKSKIVLTLRGDKAENKLLGIQFGSKSNPQAGTACRVSVACSLSVAVLTDLETQNSLSSFFL